MVYLFYRLLLGILWWTSMLPQVLDVKRYLLQFWIMEIIQSRWLSYLRVNYVLFLLTDIKLKNRRTSAHYYYYYYYFGWAHLNEKKEHIWEWESYTDSLLIFILKTIKNRDWCVMCEYVCNKISFSMKVVFTCNENECHSIQTWYNNSHYFILSYLFICFRILK